MHTGNKYHRIIRALRPDENGVFQEIVVDIYRVETAFNVTDPGCQHALKKIACRGIRGKGNALQDTMEAIDALIESARMLQAEDPSQKNLRLEILDRAQAMFSGISLAMSGNTAEMDHVFSLVREAKAAA